MARLLKGPASSLKAMGLQLRFAEEFLRRARMPQTNYTPQNVSWVPTVAQQRMPWQVCIQNACGSTTQPLSYLVLKIKGLLSIIITALGLIIRPCRRMVKLPNHMGANISRKMIPKPAKPCLLGFSSLQHHRRYAYTCKHFICTQYLLP